MRSSKLCSLEFFPLCSLAQRLPLPGFSSEVTSGGSWEHEERQWGVPSPSPSPQTFAASFTFYFRCHGFGILGVSDVELLASPGRGGSSPVAGFLSVLRAFCIRWLKRGRLCRARPPVPFKFFLCMSFLKYTVHHLGWLSVCHQKFSRDFIVSDSRLQLGVPIFCALWYMSVSPKYRARYSKPSFCCFSFQQLFRRLAI